MDKAAKECHTQEFMQRLAKINAGLCGIGERLESKKRYLHGVIPQPIEPCRPPENGLRATVAPSGAISEMRELIKSAEMLVSHISDDLQALEEV